VHESLFGNGKNIIFKKIFDLIIAQLRKTLLPYA
jgi:hypothetical protein